MLDDSTKGIRDGISYGCRLFGVTGSGSDIHKRGIGRIRHGKLIAQILYGNVKTELGDNRPIRLGTPAATSRGLKEDDFDKVAEAIAMIIKEGESAVEPAKAIIKTLTDKYPLAF